MSTRGSSNPEGQPPVSETALISQFTRREIQAPLAACLIRAFAGELGEEKALQIAAEAIQSDAASAGKAVAGQLGGNSMKELARVVRELWAADEAISFRILEESDQNLSFDVTRCRYAEYYEREGMLDLGFCLSCSRDGAFTQGFNPRILLSRTQTIMQGQPVCDFRFTLEEPGDVD
ncbi:L-2-amino-thiazoline-4-carboxylic acid hydrolase [Longilinea arvoryzae]|uniref:L-2-amino-thiazoline-4-carboxylic acid hydrolase n=1 Tax=Longilinea arvoryzae TaxID=360412 RepID=A0A0S7BBM9_9CHLR|nr:L-2-amino-thiazoline-4-carboxylic acid hydrolase [Longilinea arvoryzae]GAP12653.1 L-2-amino-thiazoline-4-carboxylic acid hydrolase [Longilinea arvoryzae]